MTDDITICCLFYGDYPRLAERLLKSLTRLDTIYLHELRIGLNAVSPVTRQLVESYVRTWGMPSRTYDDVFTVHKYPRMKQMLYSPPVSSQFVMWFDDDSYLADDAGPGWLGKVRRELQTVPMLGASYTIPIVGQQREWVRAQPWYRGKDPALRQQWRFCQGAWWAIDTHILAGLNYPWPTLDHNGGDVMLGEALYQNDIHPKHFREGVHINADEIGRESKAKRRGFSQDPVGKVLMPELPVVSTAPVAVVSSSPVARRAFLELDL